MFAGRSLNLRDAMAERQAAVDDVVDRAAAFLREDGNAVTQATRQRLQTTVDAVASYGSAAEAYTPGQMVEDLDAPGFAALATLGGGALRLVHGAKPGAGAPGPTTGPARAKRPSGTADRRRQGSGGPLEPDVEAEATPHTESRAEATPQTTREAEAARRGPPVPARDQQAERQAEKERAAAAKREAAERAKAVRAAERALRDATRELETVRQREARARTAAEALAGEQRTMEEALARLTVRRRAADAAAVEAADATSAAERVRRDAEAALAAIRDDRRPRR
jgi:hypothetical protein